MIGQGCVPSGMPAAPVLGTKGIQGGGWEKMAKLTNAFHGKYLSLPLLEANRWLLLHSLSICHSSTKGLWGGTLSSRAPAGHWQVAAWLSKSPKGFLKVPKGHVWLEGDNLRNSTDSRCYGPVPYGLIRGRICFKIWPLNDFGFLRASPNGHRFLDD
ncbi:mitochondrial inner membrane protease subunit 1 isoform X2 [Falco cherrug]|uniref:mitochondrial inner membrane protease subunit 1 isoform X2 n=1 Tax=Falco cherrug TaxID=345164 RepID=UPI000FFCA654|nr:mitochondrial inner membrane protease subunit 1 isoform X2 [Falco cherrug]